MTVSLKDLRAYSGVAATGLFAVGLLIQPPPVLFFPRFHKWVEDIHGTAWALLGLLVISYFLVLIPIWWLRIKLWSQGWADDAGLLWMRSTIVRFLPATVLFGFGFTLICKGAAADPFPKLNPIWQLFFLAYGVFLIELDESPEAVPSPGNQLSESSTAPSWKNGPPPPTPPLDVSH